MGGLCEHFCCPVQEEHPDLITGPCSELTMNWDFQVGLNKFLQGKL